MTFDIFTQFATNEEAENTGVWRDIGPGASLLIARSNNRRYAKLLTEQVALHRATLDLKNDTADNKSNEIMIECLASTILLDFKGLSYKGKPISYTVENAKVLLQHSDFRALVIRLAEDAEAYRAKLEVEQGNG